MLPLLYPEPMNSNDAEYKQSKKRNIPEDFKDISDKVPHYIFDHPECILEFLASSAAGDLASASIVKLMSYYDKSVGSDAFEVKLIPPCCYHIPLLFLMFY